MTSRNEDNGAWVVWPGWDPWVPVNLPLWSSDRPQTVLYYRISGYLTEYPGRREENICQTAAAAEAVRLENPLNNPRI